MFKIFKKIVILMTKLFLSFLLPNGGFLLSYFFPTALSMHCAC